MTAGSIPGQPGVAPRLGAEVLGDGTRFRLFADRARVAEVRLLYDDGSPRTVRSLDPVGGGYHETIVRDAAGGTLYDFVLDGANLPDPYARFFPRGVNGPAMVVETGHKWCHGAGVYRPLHQQVIYEIHVGAFTKEGTYSAACARLPALVELGVTTIEIMPVSTFPGERGWGYDGIAHFAPYPGYGTPDDLRALVDEAHRLGLSVLLDVVYNHFGPAGNYLPTFSANYFSGETKNSWGDGPNFRHPIVRDYVLSNARYWLTDFRFDGLRLDATHTMVDPSPRHILQELAEMAHAMSPRKVLIAEDERNDPALVATCGLDGVWADDFHHFAHVILTKETDGYYGSYAPSVQALAKTIRKGWFYEGQVYPTAGQPRGKPADDLTAESFIYCLQNHDQVGNRALGDRIAAGGPDAYRAMSMVLLFLPMTPLLFMGQEWAASTPFLYFTDHDPELGRRISQGRRQEFSHFRAFADETGRARIPDPQDPETFQRSKLNWDERGQGDHARVLALYHALLALRHTDPVLSQQPSRAGLDVQTRGGLLIARRTADNRQQSPRGKQSEKEINMADRVLLANLDDEPVPAAVVAAAVQKRRLLLRSDGSVGSDFVEFAGLAESPDLAEGRDPAAATAGVLPPWTAMIVARGLAT